MEERVLADTLVEFFRSSAGTDSISGAYGGTEANHPVPVSPNVVLQAGEPFLSLPTGSFVIVGFEFTTVTDGPGPDLFIEETGAAAERALVQVSEDGVNFVDLGTASGDTTTPFDLADIGFTGQIRFVRIEGLDAGGTSPGFDVVSVQALAGSFVQDVTVSVEGVTIDEGTGQALVPVRLSKSIDDPVIVSVATTDGSTTALIDYISVQQDFTIPAGSTSIAIPVDIIDDTTREDPETFNVTIESADVFGRDATVPIGQGTATVTINDNDSISVAAGAPISVDEGAGTAVIPVRLSGESEETISVAFSLVDGSATRGFDYQGVAGDPTLLFTPGETEQFVSVPIIDDLDPEGDETFSVRLDSATVLSSGETVSISTASSTVTITDNDEAPDVSVSIGGNQTVSEDVGLVFVEVTLSEPLLDDAFVTFSVREGAAQADLDYIDDFFDEETLVFFAGETTKIIAVEIIDDTGLENDEAFEISLNEASTDRGDSLAIASATSRITIQDNDGAAVPVINIAPANQTVTETGGTATYTVTLSEAASSSVSVQYNTRQGSATVSDDFGATSGTLTFAPGTLTRTITVPIVDDGVAEPNETFFVDLFAPSNATLGNDVAETVIQDGGATPTMGALSIDDVEVDEDLGPAVFFVTLSQAPAAGQTVSVNYATVPESASPGEDYDTTTGTLTFNAGEVAKTISVPIIDVIGFEPTETFVVQLSNPTGGATLADDQGRGTIFDIDFDIEPPEVVGLSINDITVAEFAANAVFTLSLSEPIDSAVVATVSTAGGTAEPNNDYIPTTGNVVIPGGTSSATFSVPLRNDPVIEGIETIDVQIESAGTDDFDFDVELSDAVGTARLTDLDPLELIPIYRFFNGIAQGHFFTGAPGERDFVIDSLPIFSFEGTGFQALAAEDPSGGAQPVYRFFNANSQGHFFTQDPAERDFVINNLPSFSFEGIGFNAFTRPVPLDGVDQDPAMPVYRFFNTVNSGHFFTIDPAERDFVTNNLPQYVFEGVGFYAYDQSFQPILEGTPNVMVDALF